jgi:hypothetical protein
MQATHNQKEKAKRRLDLFILDKSVFSVVVALVIFLCLALLLY